MPSGDLDERELYAVVRRAVRDGIWDVIGTVAAAGFAALLLLVGVAFVSTGLRVRAGVGAWLHVAFGVVLTTLAAVYVLREFDLLPFRD